jgi:voltage-gated potassium channel
MNQITLPRRSPPAKRRRLIIWAVLRGLLVTTVMVVLYYLVPLDQPWDTGTAVRLLIGLLVFAGLTVWQIRAIAASRYPAMRAFETLGLIVPFYLLLFASTYFVMERASAANFTQPLTHTDALYFSVTVFATVVSGTLLPNPRPPGSCSSFRCSPTSHCWAPARGCCWGRCAAASSEDPIPAAAPARRPDDALPAPHIPSIRPAELVRVPTLPSGSRHERSIERGDDTAVSVIRQARAEDDDG